MNQRRLPGSDIPLHLNRPMKPPGLVETEEVEVERELPAEDNQSIERIEPRERPDPPPRKEMLLMGSLVSRMNWWDHPQIKNSTFRTAWV